MSTLEKAARQALEALNLARAAHGQMLLSDPPQEAWKAWNVNSAIHSAMDALRTAIEQAEKQEPPPEYQMEAEARAYAVGFWKALEASRAAQRQWVGLTDEEIRRIACGDVECWSLSEAALFKSIASAIEAKLKEKNSG